MKFSRMAGLGLYFLFNDVEIRYITMPRTKSWSYRTKPIGTQKTPSEVVEFNIDRNRKYLHQVLYEGMDPEAEEAAG